ncbi:ribosome silencing factor [Caenispirillum bisanense]|uniref:ribosome silencing factor n=1 Tax=Caenispirillum bisanense TaxID=414052 RepID=UPI0031DAAAD5
MPLDPAEVVELVESVLEDSKAEDVIVIGLAGKSSIAEYMVIASGRSSRQVASAAEHLVEKLKAVGLMPSVEGKAAGDWVLVDAGDVVVHLFRPEVRAFYNLEKMWGVANPARPPVAADAAASSAAYMA